jgi:hypothetical protein
MSFLLLNGREVYPEHSKGSPGGRTVKSNPKVAFLVSTASIVHLVFGLVYLLKTSVIILPIDPLGTWICNSAATVGAISVVYTFL